MIAILCFVLSLTIAIVSPATTPGSIYTPGCHDPPSLASGGGRLLNSTTFRYWCARDYSMQGFNYIYCINNKWAGPIPQCVPKYANPGVDTVIKVNRQIKQAEPLPDWFLMVILGCLGLGGLSAIVAMLMCCLHMLGCYSGPVMSFGAKHVYPRGPLCTCRDYCCFCCRCCKFCRMCCVGDEGDDEDENNEETKVAMIKNENHDQYPKQSTEIFVKNGNDHVIKNDKSKRKIVQKNKRKSKEGQKANISAVVSSDSQ